MMRAWILILALPAGLQAAGNPDFSLRSGAQALAMGEVAAAADQGVESVAWNPAGLAGQKDVQVTLGHTDWAGLSDEQLFLAAPTGYGTLGLSGFYNGAPNLDQRDNSGQITGSLTYSNLGGTLAWGQSFGGLSLGLEGGGWQLNNGGMAQSGLQVDAGAQYRLGGLVLGGAGFQLESQPSWQGSALWIVGGGAQTLRIGGGYIDEGYDSRWGLGGEYKIFDRFALRAGWQIAVQPAVIQGLSGPTAGFGVQWGSLGVDYAWMPLGELGQVQRGQLSWKFNTSGVTGAQKDIGTNEAAPPVQVPSEMTTPSPTNAEPELQKKEVKLKFVVPAD